MNKDDHPLKVKPMVRCPRSNMASTRLQETHLPPILRVSTPYEDSSSEKQWSRYHHGCVDRSSPFLDWTSRKGMKKKLGSGKGRGRILRDPLKDEEEIVLYLDQHRGFLEKYVTDRVSAEELERWLLYKLKMTTVNIAENGQITTMSKEKSSKKSSFMDLIGKLRENTSEYQLVLELAGSVATAVGVEVYRIYKLRGEQPDVVQYFVVDNKVISKETHHMAFARAESDTAAFILELARGGIPLRISSPDSRGLPSSSISGRARQKEPKRVMYQPMQTLGETSYVMEMWKNAGFLQADEEISANLTLWGVLAVHFRGLYEEKIKERNMADFLLDVVKAIFEEMVSLDQLIKRILEFAQRLVNADRASLFLVDYRNFELVSTVFDLKFEPGQDRDMEKKEIRMPINRGIAGHVALSGETMNIPDAYSDYRFNRDVDEATGYKTVSILCMPIKVEGKVIGVVQMVNKRSEKNFGHEDEVAFEIFSTFFGLALHHARLYDRIMRKEQKYKVALEVLSYHNTCRENEVQTLLVENGNVDVNLNDFYLDPYSLNEFEKCQCALTMFNELFDMSTFDVMTVTRFILTVKKNYRTVPYHNFDHGWAVAHAMYVILKTDARKRFDYKMRLALFVACLCHDLDHRGYTNKYMSETASPLAAMYTTSTLEHHHFNITVTILQQEGHNIFSHMSGEDYKEILGFIRQAILATDLAAFFPNLEKMKDLHKENDVQFDWSNTSHRDLAMAISMTSADLSASAKPWDIQIKTVKVIFEEFYAQGDKEAAAGRTPIPMMDRTKPEEQPASQVGFLSQICIPCYTVLSKVLPNTKPMYLMAMKNLHRWKARADKIAKMSFENKGDVNLEQLLADFEAEEEIEETPIEVKDVDETKVEEIVENLATNDDNNGVLQPVEALRQIVPSWEEDVDEDKNVNKSFWKNTNESWVDDEGVVLKIKPKANRAIE
ncbi:probable 3',5'-cyclic phosphodiesterase pde-5 isoform X2 [Amyelois transitella]|uniref:probable 3',5'-cyclic phosphodiesterase pde-5 isoform X2 n=1 Tax=Amyelois transitella TaxID=680683 RepID=UPI00298F5D53|nr:probable 3',5'-cyclic phosphodiesterase pde-5 isoform X2 [Amyelois transitella]